MNAKSFHISVQGASHIKKNKECQDASFDYHDFEKTIAMVCDGHGGDDYMRSASGSGFACVAADRNIKSFLSSVDKNTFFADPEMHLKNLEASIINTWNQLITAHHEKHPFTEEELSGVSEKARKKYTQDGRIESAYGTTMIAVAMGKGYWFGIHIGDGKCVAVNPEGKFVQPIPWDPKCFLNATTSICDSDALSSFRHFYSDKMPAAVFVGSDGIDDCFSNNEQLHNLYKTILYSFGTTNFTEAVNGLKDYLPRLSAKGSGDDVSIAAILDLDMISELDVVKQFDQEKEKARVEENARKEAEKNEAERRRVEEEHAKFQRENNKGKSEKRPKFCVECGAPLETEAKFCGECGVKVVHIPGQSAAGSPQEIRVFSVKQDIKNEAPEAVPQPDAPTVPDAVEAKEAAEDSQTNDRLSADGDKVENTDDGNLSQDTQYDEDRAAADEKAGSADIDSTLK